MAPAVSLSPAWCAPCNASFRAYKAFGSVCISHPRSRRPCPSRQKHGTLASAHESSSTVEPAPGPKSQSLRAEAVQSNNEVYDKVIEVFADKKPSAWRKLIAYSKQWRGMADGILKRLDTRADAASARDAVEEAATLRKLSRRLRAVHEELEQYVSLAEAFRKQPPGEWESMVTTHRPTLTMEFFSHLELMYMAAGAWEDAAAAKQEQEALATLSTNLAALVTAHDSVLSDESALGAARASLAELLSVGSMEEADAKIDSLAASGRLDPALLLTLGRAYNGVKESEYTREEVKDVMAHLYFKAKESFAAQAPVEVRILKHLLSVDSPSDRAVLLDQAFQPGATLVQSGVDMLSTTPGALLNAIANVLALFDKATQGVHVGDSDPSSLASQAAAMMQPEVIARMRDLAALIRKKYT
ncbi:CGL143 [Auxenochlorella protothecoides x Auxenochlorella symbiontica]